MGSGILPVSVLIAALAALFPAVVLNGREKWRDIARLSLCVILLLMSILFRESITEGLGAIGNGIGHILTAKTGYFFPDFETGGQTLAASAAVGIALGSLIAAVVRFRGPAALPLLCGGVFGACVYGIFQPGAWLALFLLGAVLCLGRNATGKASLWTAALILAVGGGCMLLLGFLQWQPEDGGRLTSRIHELRYEDGKDPLPEGGLSVLGRRDPSRDAALEITMDQWQGVYLRGFVGSRYTGSGWEAEDNEVLAGSAELLYTLQKSYFHPYEQTFAAGEALGYEQGNRVSVKILGACKAYSYLPYGIGGTDLDPRDLAQPSAGGFFGTLGSVEDAYLMQKELSDGAGTERYLDAEHAYRQWVYSHYLDVPDEVKARLSVLTEGGEAYETTAQAKERITAWLEQTLRYDTDASTKAGDTELVKYLLDVSGRGYSVHYATLGTLAMRAMGIPARYVEGYIVPRETAEALEAGQTLTLSFENAHAWVEYYLDGIGWIPFEVTPGYENELVYRLPPDGTGARDRQEDTALPQEEPPPVKQQPDPGSQTKLHRTGLVRDVLLSAVLLIILALLIRTVILRRRLKARADRFRREGSRESLLDCLSYQADVLEAMGLQRRNVPILKREWDITQLLFGEDVKPVLLLAQELRFSDHPVTREQHRQVLAALDRLTEIWKRKTPLRRRIVLRWIRCKVL